MPHDRRPGSRSAPRRLFARTLGSQSGEVPLVTGLCALRTRATAQCRMVLGRCVLIVLLCIRPLKISELTVAVTLLLYFKKSPDLHT